MSSIETFSIVDDNISSIDCLNQCSYIKLDYEYRLNLKVDSCKCSSIYLHDIDIYSGLIKPMKGVLEGKSLEEVSVISNNITPDDSIYYDCLRSLKSKLLQLMIKYNGCNYKLKLKYNISDNKLMITPSIIIKSLIVNHLPIEIQPDILVLSFENAYRFIDILNSL